MALFKRRGKTAADSETPAPDGTGSDASAPDATDETTAAADATAADEPAAGSAGSARRGPWDLADADERPGRVDLGALRIPGIQGMQLRMELDRTSKAVIAANVSLGQSTLQLQVFAAPRTAGIWDDIRPQISASITAQGGEVKEMPGPWGTELLALLPVKDASGKTGRVPARFLGVDGPRWFLRGILRGAALVDQNQRAIMERYFSEVVVVRGSEPRPPSELLTLTMPGQATRPVPTPGQPAAVDDILTRGPEISEVR
ncbi:uncharacterized protein DUF3710 [Salana multivorans]|uniref:Uncharacterized protein DUF3710 n=1 Tax=Salana multivorans TaxID=120377 RepID=A0A3N2D1Z5_9MICO|nr:DUF3710 domain-containing protein [Salana multivorans]ROR93668.1 uncharacterized protein DUF3710 [Salana multivorans]